MTNLVAIGLFTFGISGSAFKLDRRTRRHNFSSEVNTAALDNKSSKKGIHLFHNIFVH